MKLPRIQDAHLHGKRVIIRFDGDVPIEKGVIQDTNRLESALPTIRWCLNHGAMVVLITHMGRPSQPHPEASLSTKQLVPFFEKALGEPVKFYDDWTAGPTNDRISLLENLRFDPREEKNDPSFAKRIAAWGDIYVNDAFAVSHRAHTSFVALPRLLPHYAGIHLQEEIKALSSLLHGVDRPYTVVLGGAKASDKSPIIADLIDKVDSLVIGGLVAVTYLAAMGYSVGAHKVEADQIKLAQHCIKKIHEAGINLVVPEDFISQHKKVKILSEWGRDDLMLDIGPQTQKTFTQALHKANTIFWNGAMGKFEDAAFGTGTLAVARGVAHSGAEVRIAAGGDTVSAIKQFKMEKAFTFISTGGGATLEFLAVRKLPGLKALEL